MMQLRRTPLAWRNLTHEPRRTIASLAGVVFAVTLMFMQRGFQNALLDSTTVLFGQFDCDLVILSKSRYVSNVSERFARRRLAQAEADPDVLWARPLYLESVAGTWKHPETGAGRNIRVVGYDPMQELLLAPEIRRQKEKLLAPETALMDRRSKPKYGPRREGVVTELTGRRLAIVGLFSLGTDFANDGNLVMSARNFQAYFPDPYGQSPSLAKVDMGLVRVRSGRDLRSVQQRLKELLPGDVLVLTKQELIEQERRFWDGATPIGFVFGMGTIMGFLVGLVVCYQILFSDIVEHRGQFATLKAMGYSNRDLVVIVLEQAAIVALIGFVPGFLISIGLYRVLASATGLLFQPTAADSLFILVLSVGMCIASGMVALRRLFDADPAELF